MSLLRKALLLSAVLALVAAAVCPAMSYTDWQICITQAGRDCPLDPGVYYIPGTLHPAANVHLRGTSYGMWGTTLVRQSPTTNPIMQVDGGVTGVQIENLTFDGNRSAFPNSWFQNQSYGYFGPQGGTGCTPGNYPAFDLDVLGMAFVSNVGFWGAPGHAARLYNGTVANSEFWYARSTGLWLYNSAAALFNKFNYNGTAGITAAGSSSSYSNYVWGNQLYKNRYEMSDYAGGGQIYVHPSSLFVFVAENIIDGASYKSGDEGLPWACFPPPVTQAVYGIEVEAGSSFSYVLNNEVVHHTGSGIEVINANGVYISGVNFNCTGCSIKYVHDNVGWNPPFGNPAHGVSIISAGGSNTVGLVLDKVRSRNNSGDSVHIQPNTQGYGYYGDHCLAPYPVVEFPNTLSYPYPSNTAYCP